MLNLIREIIKDMQDINGDNLNNIKTLPIMIGISPTIILLWVLSIIFILISMHPLYTSKYSTYYIPLILFSIHIPLLYIMWGLRVNITTKKLNHFSNVLKIMIINGIIIIMLSH
jgi:4-hydroxybenzoate polyprenyltransferase